MYLNFFEYIIVHSSRHGEDRVQTTVFVIGKILNLSDSCTY
jgi:hypothetical protein